MRTDALILRSRKLPHIVLDAGLQVSMAGSLVEIANDLTVFSNIGSHSFPHPYSYQDALDFIQKNREIGGDAFAIDFAILYEGSLAGIIGISDINLADRSAHIGYFVGQRYRGRGVASAALSALTDFSFSELKLHRLHTKVFSDNTPSIRVLQKCRYTQEGVEKDAFMQDGFFRDFLVFAKINFPH